jgi:hypothetical protein
LETLRTGGANWPSWSNSTRNAGRPWGTGGSDESPMSAGTGDVRRRIDSRIRDERQVSLSAFGHDIVD